MNEYLRSSGTPKHVLRVKGSEQVREQHNVSKFEGNRQKLNSGIFTSNPWLSLLCFSRTLAGPYLSRNYFPVEKNSNF